MAFISRWLPLLPSLAFRAIFFAAAAVIFDFHFSLFSRHCFAFSRQLSSILFPVDAGVFFAPGHFSHFQICTLAICLLRHLLSSTFLSSALSQPSQVIFLSRQQIAAFYCILQ